MEHANPPLRTVQRTFEILDILQEEKSVGVAELSRRMDLPKSTLHDYLRTLLTLGIVVKDGQEYTLSFRLLELGGKVKHRNRLFHVAKPELERLVDATGEIASVNVEDRGQFVILHAEYGEESLQLGMYPGMTIPLHTHAAGKVILAGFSEEKADRVLDERGLERRTEQTITDREELMTELDRVRERGYGIDWNEQVVGMGVVAAPVTVDDHVVGAIGLVCPSDRLNDSDYRAELASEVQESANIVAVNYQYS